jgi:hypothetical protein
MILVRKSVLEWFAWYGFISPKTVVVPRHTYQPFCEFLPFAFQASVRSLSCVFPHIKSKITKLQSAQRISCGVMNIFNRVRPVPSDYGRPNRGSSKCTFTPALTVNGPPGV